MESKISFHELKKTVRQNHCSSNEEDEYSEWMKSVRVTLGILRARPWNLRSIYKVPNKLRKLKEEAYSPCIVSIGPFHQQKTELLGMEEHKWRYMLAFLHRTPDPEMTLDECGKAISCLEESARGCYAENIHLNKNMLVEILLVDGCFILELFLRYSDNNFRDKNDPIISNAWMVPTIRYDLALLENQIPIIVLEKLFEIIDSSSTLECRLPEYIIRFFLSASKSKMDDNSRHLLDMLHKFYLPTSPKMDPKGKLDTWGFKYCATQLVEAGIQFEKGTTTIGHSVDITFSDGVIMIPPLCIDETMDSLFRNLIAFEQCRFGGTHHITSYAMLMRSLIHSSQDVKLLQRKGIIMNNLGGGCVEDISTFFNSVCREVVLRDFYFGGLCEDVNKYRKSWLHWYRYKALFKARWRRYMAALRHDYFTNPWRIISFIAAVVLLILTALQTIYTMRS